VESAKLGDSDPQESGWRDILPYSSGAKSTVCQQLQREQRHFHEFMRKQIKVIDFGSLGQNTLKCHFIVYTTNGTIKIIQHNLSSRSLCTLEEK